MQTYALDTFDDHMIITLPGDDAATAGGNLRALIDTGWDQTLGQTGHPSLDLLNHTYRVKPTYAGRSVSELNKLVGTNFHYLIGTNVLCKHTFYVEWEAKQFHLLKGSQALPPLSSKDVCLRLSKQGISTPLIDFDLLLPGRDTQERQRHTCFIDTGAKVSYIVSKAVPKGDQERAVDKAEDFFPSFGVWETNLFSLPVALVSDEEAHGTTTTDVTSLDVKFGMLPSLLEKAMLGGTCSAILGSDLFKHYRRVGIDLAGGLLYLSPSS
ncbi:hypothetical protein QOT17_020255 [Balamuthia mandrillaris]